MNGIAHSALLATCITRQEECAGSDGGRGVLYEFPVEESNFHEEASDVLRLGVFHDRVTAGQTKPGFGGGMADDPLNGVENMMLHLNKS